MFQVAQTAFDKLTEIVARWTTNSDNESATVKSIRDKLTPLLASFRGLCVTPEDAQAIEVYEDYDYEADGFDDSVVLELVEGEAVSVDNDGPAVIPGLDP